MKNVFLILVLISFLSSCIIVKYDKQQKKDVKKVVLSQKPRIAMSNQVVRSDFGDLICYIPQDWFFVDVQTRPEVFSTSVNQDYSLSLVFDELKSNSDLNSLIQSRDYIELAKYSLSEQKSRATGKLDLVNDYEVVQVGELKFVTYYTTNTSGALLSRTALIITEFDHCYRMTLLPMDIIGKPIPMIQQIDIIFESILTTLKY